MQGKGFEHVFTSINRFQSHNSNKQSPVDKLIWLISHNLVNKEDYL